MITNVRIKLWVMVIRFGKIACLFCCNILLTIMAFLKFFKILLFSLPPRRSSFKICLLGIRCQRCRLMLLWGAITQTDICKLFEWKKRDKTHYKKRECCSTIHLAASGLGPVHCPQCGEWGEGKCWLLELTHFLNHIQPH